MTYSGYVYKCSAGESFDSVALEVYGDEKYAAEILSFNPALGDKLVFAGGEELRLPEINIPENMETGAIIGTAPWKE